MSQVQADERTCGECGRAFTPPNRTNPARFCSQACAGAARTRRAKQAAQAKREEREREQRDAREQRKRDRLAELKKRALKAPACGSTGTGASTKPRLRIEQQASEWQLERQSDPVYAAVEVASLIEHHRSTTAVSLDELGARLEHFSQSITVPGSGVRTLFRIRTGESETVELTTVDAIVLAIGSHLPFAGLTTLADALSAAKVMVNTKAELDEEYVSTAELQEAAHRLHHFSLGFLAGIEDVDLTEPEPVEERESDEVAA